MDISWLILSLILLIALVFLITRKVRPIWQKVFTLFLLLFAFLFTSFKTIVPLYPPLMPSGEFKTTTLYKYFTHETNFKGMETEGNLREIPVKIWMAKEANRDKYPIIIFSHGSFGTPESNESLFLELASRGYMVLSLAHPHHSFVAELKNGNNIHVKRSFFNEVMSSQGAQNLEDTKEKFTIWNGIRVEDLNFVIDSILENKEKDEIFSKIDTDKIILAGHSLGGASVLEIGRKRANLFKGVISLEAPFFGDITGIKDGKYTFINEEYPLPILHFYSDALWGKLNTITTYEMNQRLIDLNKDKFKNVHISGTGHIGLTDMSFVSPLITNMIDGGLNTRSKEEKTKEINNNVIEFLKFLGI